MPADTKEAPDLDKLRAIAEKLELADVQPLVVAGLDLFEDLGRLIIGAAQIQKKSNEAYEFMMKMGQNPQPFLSMLVEKTPSDLLKDAVTTVLQVVALQPELSQFEKLTPDKKIELGRKLVELASHLKKRIREVENAKTSK